LKHTGPAEASLRLFDVAGREVLTKIATENQTIRIDSAKLAAGIYYLQCITDERIFVLKIVVEGVKFSTP
jgi:hypothetical protein